jgi:hypothetical protein
MPQDFTAQRRAALTRISACWWTWPTGCSGIALISHAPLDAAAARSLATQLLAAGGPVNIGSVTAADLSNAGAARDAPHA